MSKRKPKGSRETLSIGIAWYSPRTWSRVKETASDPEVFESTYEEWVKIAEESLITLRNAGAKPEKVLIDSDEFESWCKANRVGNNSKSRSTYAAEKIRERHEKSEGPSTV